MKTDLCIKLAAIALAGFLPSCSSSSETLRVQVSSPSKIDASLAGRIHQNVNAYRASKGMPALQRHPGLDRLAQQHCDYLVKTSGSYGIYGNNISHIGFEGRALSASQAYKITTLGENVVSSTNHSAEHLVSLWVGSRNHEHNMRSDWFCTGIATAVNADGQVISTQLFGTAPSLSQRVSADRFYEQW